MERNEQNYVCPYKKLKLSSLCQYSYSQKKKGEKIQSKNIRVKNYRSMDGQSKIEDYLVAENIKKLFTHIFRIIIVN